MVAARCLQLAAAQTTDLGVVRAFVAASGREAGLDDAQVDDVVQAVDEVVTNALVHGYRKEPGPIAVEWERDGERFIVRIRDEAPIFDPRPWPRPEMERPLERRRPGGFGIHLVRDCVDEIHHRGRRDGSDRGNELTLVKLRSGGKEPT
jgi:serine/threonine-protein kinase RsbW